MPPVAIPFARSQPYDNSAYVRAMADLMMRRGDVAAAAALQRGQNTQQAWDRVGNITMATFAGIGQQRDEERDRAMRQANLEREYAMKQQEMQERAKERAADIAWRQQQYETEQKRYGDTVAQQQAGEVGLEEPVSKERFQQTFAGHPAAGQFRSLPGQPAMPAWEAPAEGDAMADAGPATPAVPMSYLRNPNPQESLALRSAALAEQDRATRDRQFTIEQGQRTEQQRQAQANTDRSFNEEKRQFGITTGLSRERLNAEKAPFGNTAYGGLTGQELLDALPAGTKELVSAVKDYRADIKQVTSMRGDRRQQLAQLVLQVDPTFDMAQYANRAALAKDFRTGKSANNIRSLNTAVGHLDSFAKNAAALNNSSFQKINQLKNWWNMQTGDPNISKLLENANAVEGELANVFKGTGATDQEIKEWRRNFNAASSPAQFKAVVEEAISLMGSRLNALQYQYETGMAKPKDFDILSPKSRKILQGLGVDPDTMERSSAVEDPNSFQIDWFNQARQGAPTMFGPRESLAPPVPTSTRRPTFGPGG